MDQASPASERSQLQRNQHHPIDDHEPSCIGPEVFALARATLPISVSFALQNVAQTFSVSSVGSPGPFEPEATAYGYMFATCTGTMVAIGGATALDTLCSQALTSGHNTNDPKFLALYLQQSLMILSASLTPYALSLIIGLVEFVSIMAARTVFGCLFTDDESVVAVTTKILPLMAGFQVLDLANGGAGGILRGAGKNHLAGICAFVAYSGVGLTSGWYLCFQTEFGVFGLWLGIITGSAALLVLQISCILLIPWDRLAGKISGQE